MKHSEEEVRAWIWAMQQLYKRGILLAEDIAKCESVPQWKWQGEKPPSVLVLSRVLDGNLEVAHDLLEAS